MAVFKSQYAEVNGIRLHYVSIGQGKLIMFVHGFPEYWAEWENQLIEFGKDHQAVAMDMRGYNLSSKPRDAENYHVKYLIEDLRALAEHLSDQKVVLVAHDWGGAVAWSAAIRQPDWIEKLVIINAPHPAVFARELLHNSNQQKASQYMLMFRSPKAEKVLAENNYSGLLKILFQFGSKWELTDKVRSKYIAAWSQPGALAGGLNYYRASPLFSPESQQDKEKIEGILNLPHDMLEVRVPTLVIWGEQDQALLPGNLDGLSDFVNDLTIKRIPDGTHWVIHEQPDRVNRLIREFIGSN